MSDQVAFATATFGGFEKKQVLDYIYKMHEDIDIDKTKHKKKMEEISIAFKELEDLVRANDIERVTLQEQIQKLEISVLEEKRLQKDFAIEKELLEQKIIQYERIIEQRQQQEQLASSHINEEEAVNFLQKKRELEEYSAQIGRVMLEAQAKANQVLSSAQEESDTLRQQGQKDAQRFMEDAQRVLDDQHHENIRLLRQQKEEFEKSRSLNISQQTLDRIIQAYSYAHHMVEDIALATNSANAHLESLNQQVNYLKQSTSGIGTNLDELSSFVVPESAPIAPEPTPLVFPRPTVDKPEDASPLVSSPPEASALPVDSPMAGSLPSDLPDASSIDEIDLPAVPQIEIPIFEYPIETEEDADKLSVNPLLEAGVNEDEEKDKAEGNPFVDRFSLEP